MFDIFIIVVLSISFSVLLSYLSFYLLRKTDILSKPDTSTTPSPTPFVTTPSETTYSGTTPIQTTPYEVTNEPINEINETVYYYIYEIVKNMYIKTFNINQVSQRLLESSFKLLTECVYKSVYNLYTSNDVNIVALLMKINDNKLAASVAYTFGTTKMCYNEKRILSIKYLYDKYKYSDINSIVTYVCQTIPNGMLSSMTLPNSVLDILNNYIP